VFQLTDVEGGGGFGRGGGDMFKCERRVRGFSVQTIVYMCLNGKKSPFKTGSTNMTYNIDLLHSFLWLILIKYLFKNSEILVF
jgi:hypothetical protein